VGTALDRALFERLGLHADVRLLPLGTLPRTEVGKAVRMVSWADGPSPVPGVE
jgi:hypothetical protein